MYLCWLWYWRYWASYLIQAYSVCYKFIFWNVRDVRSRCFIGIIGTETRGTSPRLLVINFMKSTIGIVSCECAVHVLCFLEFFSTEISTFLQYELGCFEDFFSIANSSNGGSRCCTDSYSDLDWYGNCVSSFRMTKNVATYLSTALLFLVIRVVGCENRWWTACIVMATASQNFNVNTKTTRTYPATNYGHFLAARPCIA